MDKTRFFKCPWCDNVFSQNHEVNQETESIHQKDSYWVQQGVYYFICPLCRTSSKEISEEVFKELTDNKQYIPLMIPAKEFKTEILSVDRPTSEPKPPKNGASVIVNGTDSHAEYNEDEDYDDAHTTVSILGTMYDIVEYNDDLFARIIHAPVGECGGWCNHLLKTIFIAECDTTENNVDTRKVMKKMHLRHEIVHAFLCESGIDQNSMPVDAWGVNEEMVEWFAVQGPKIYEAWKEANAL